jgi:hypothetical protein
MKSIQFIGYTPEQLQAAITASIEGRLDDFLKNFKPKEPNEYLTRRNIADMFAVDISTVHNWTKSGKLHALGISGRVYYLRSQVEASLKPLNF